MAFRSALFSLIALLVLSTGFAQRLAAVLPDDTVFALGTESLAEHSGKLDAFLAEAGRLELGEALNQLFGAGAEEWAPDDDTDLPAALEDVEPLELLGQEAWFAVSISSYNPMPALTLIARTTGDATGQVSDAIRETVEKEGAEAAAEGAATIYLFPVEEDDSPFPVLALSQVDDVVAMSTNPDVLRAVLRRLAGSGEAGFTASSGFQETLGALGDANIYTYLDYTRLAGGLEPLGAATGFEPLIARLVAGVGTIGTSGSVMRVERDGLVSESIRIPGAGDPAFASLLLSTEPASREPLAFVPPESLGVSASRFDLAGWWNYLGDLARSSDELGNPNLDELVLQFTGIDLRSTLFDWMGTQAATITVGLGTTVEPGVPSENLLGETIYMVETDDEAAASAGLSQLFGTISALVAGFADPMAQGGAPAIAPRDVGGVQVTSYIMAPGVTVAQAVVDGWVLLATSDAAIEGALLARSTGAGPGGDVARLTRDVPANATSYSLTDLGETLAQTGSQMATQAQMFAGMTGGQIDFDALDRATEAIEAFFAFVADRAGGSVSYTVTEASGLVRTFGRSEVSW